MPFGSAESRGEECPNQFPCESMADDKTAEGHDIQIVVLHALMRGEDFVNEARTLFAATDAPTPIPQMAMPRSRSPPETARTSGTTESG